MSDLLKKTALALLPKGAFWEVAPDEDLDHLYDGQAANFETVRIFLSELADIRNPNKTTVLDDLEKEFGITKNDNITESVRRMQLASRKFSRDNNASEDKMQTVLQDADFDVQVHQNDPAVDPAIFLDQTFQMVAGGGNAFAGRPDAFASRIGGELLVNGDIFEQFAAFDMQANGSIAFAGNSSAVAGFFTNFREVQIVPPVPTDPDAWPFIFFVGGDATRDPGTGALTAIENGEVPASREKEFKSIILKYKPMFTWAGLLITYV